MFSVILVVFATPTLIFLISIPASLPILSLSPFLTTLTSLFLCCSLFIKPRVMLPFNSQCIIQPNVFFDPFHQLSHGLKGDFSKELKNSLCYASFFITSITISTWIFYI